MQDLFSEKDIRETYREVYDLFVTRHIIKQHSSNKMDIRDVALEGLDLTSFKNILELGCGYGFFAEKLQNRLHDQALVTGLDLVENNRDPFLHSVQATGYKGKFINARAESIKEMTSNSYDLVIASYSLYFFPELAGEIARILAPEGIFIAITHSAHTLEEAIRLLPLCLSRIKISIPDEFLINRLFRAFSSENGTQLLQQHFPRVSCILYENNLYFNRETVDDCIYYIAKKKHLFYKEVVNRFPDSILDIEACLAERIYKTVKEKGFIALNKNDAVFHCTFGATKS